MRSIGKEASGAGKCIWCGKKIESRARQTEDTDTLGNRREAMLRRFPRLGRTPRSGLSNTSKKSITFNCCLS